MGAVSLKTWALGMGAGMLMPGSESQHLLRTGIFCHLKSPGLQF